VRAIRDGHAGKSSGGTKVDLTKPIKPEALDRTIAAGVGNNCPNLCASGGFGAAQ